MLCVWKINSDKLDISFYGNSPQPLTIRTIYKCTSLMVDTNKGQRASIAKGNNLPQYF